MRNNIGLTFLEFDTIQNYRHNPTVYVELAGNALYTPYVLNYAPPRPASATSSRASARFRARRAGQGNLADSPDVWNRVAREENDGNIGLIDQHAARRGSRVAEGGVRVGGDSRDRGAEGSQHLPRSTLSKKTSDWRLGKDKYARKFAYVLRPIRRPSSCCAGGGDLQATRMEMEKLAAPKTIKQALDEIAKQHATPDTYMATRARRSSRRRRSCARKIW
jgi:hypothetical protein